jgi:putative NADPH-quinone reductase
VRDSFIQGIVDSGNEYEISDLYKMDFKTDMSENEYLRDSNYRNTPNLATDVLAEQRKVNSADAMVLIYPVFWTEAPAKLVGWFDRVWTYGFAYGEKTMKTLDKALILCTAGNQKSHLEKYGLLYSMKKVMLGDRLFNRVKDSEFCVFDGMTKAYQSRDDNWDKNLQTAYEKGKNLFAEKAKVFSLDDRYFVAVENSASGEVSESTVFCYHQQDNTIWAEYSGGKIRKGFLVGTIDQNHGLHFTYQHINTDDELKSGQCDSQLQVLPNGKLRYNESWQWLNGESGTSVIEEI